MKTGENQLVQIIKPKIMKSNILFIAISILSLFLFSACAEEVIEPSVSKSDAAGITIEDENW